MATASIAGIPCRIQSRDIRHAIRTVLSGVRQRHPKHYARLVERVRAIRWLPNSQDRTVGRWDSKATLYDKDGRWVEEGIVYLSRELARGPRWKIVAVVAHEFGHACTTEADVRRRHCPKRKWAYELCADWYAYQWGFGSELRQYMPSRDMKHHLAGPGTEFQVGERRYQITRHFVCRRCRWPQKARQSHATTG